LHKGDAAMIKNKKGMAAIIDAFIFITIIGLIGAGMFAYSSMHEKDALAKTMHDTFFGIELKTNDLFDDTDSQRNRMCDLIAAYLATGSGTAKEYAEGVLNEIIPPIYGYSFTFEYEGSSMSIGNGGNRMSSQYSADIAIVGGKVMHTVLTIY
jgi:hypothetical protein